VAFAARVSAAVEALHRSVGHTHKVWNIEAKMQALLGEATEAGVELFWNAIAFGALAESNRVRGVAGAARPGPVGIVGQAVVDATGDGDVAAFAGAEAVYGAARDRGAMWYSLAQFVRPGRTRNNFTSMVDVTNVQDYTRAILAGRRRGGDCHDHGV